jgi:hypothetical protein
MTYSSIAAEKTHYSEGFVMVRIRGERACAARKSLYRARFYAYTAEIRSQTPGLLSFPEFMTFFFPVVASEAKQSSRTTP